jgi:dTDP-glucose pyrophosphorylase
LKAVVLAAGRGSRMQVSSPGDPPLDAGQRAAADAGTKTLVPFHGHPLLSHILSALAGGGIGQVCLVVGPGEDPVRRHYEGLQTERLRISFAVQEAPTGSAHALLAAEAFAGSDPVLVVNGDNLYPSDVVRTVCRLDGDGLAGFRAGALARDGGIPPERIAAFALLQVGSDGCLADIVEKPDAAELARFGPDPLVSMTCWRFTPAIFDACRRVAPSPRGEYELPDAVLLRIREGGTCVRVVPIEAGVLDLTRRADISRVGEFLRDREVRL